nr:unnamed protein product [Callosobruchus chinensis]
MRAVECSEGFVEKLYLSCADVVHIMKEVTAPIHGKRYVQRVSNATVRVPVRNSCTLRHSNY